MCFEFIVDENSIEYSDTSNYAKPKAIDCPKNTTGIIIFHFIARARGKSFSDNVMGRCPALEQ